jgi:hypothetical protein
MSVLNNFKLVDVKRNNQLSPMQHRRNKLIKKLWEQMEFVKAKQHGEIYAPKRLRTVTNKVTGERATVEMAKRIRPWYWTTDSGKVCLSIHYGAKVIALAKGMTAIELANETEVLPTLEKIKAAVEAGELDGQIEAVSSALPIFVKKGV